ncbi:MAG: hypothetical protein EYC70_02270 [Planctomycetota bacterium]|nr:MAG: hypothetical protein EYC70_02270 [Planctomycetota bacterium]
MHMAHSTIHEARSRVLRLAVPGLILALSACQGDDGAAGPPGSPGPPGSGGGGGDDVLTKWDDLPGLVIEILEVSGGSLNNNRFRAGDMVSVRFTVENDDGDPIALAELDSGSILLSGPSFNYQRVIERQTDLISRSRANDNGSYTYTFASPIPSEYLAPYNDSPSFGEPDGELAGQALLDGTYTVGIEAYRIYTVDGEDFRDASNVAFDFLLGNTATTVESREIVLQQNCNRCHSDLRAHGGSRKEVTHCVLCHTSGAEDRNTSTVGNGTPGVSIDFAVMIHKIHNAAHLPSVLGVSTDTDGSRIYDPAAAEPYQMIGFGNRLIDFSHIVFPEWPNLTSPMPRDQGHSGLGSTEQGLEDTIRMGVTDCAACHGDPDGDGPALPPAQGDFAYSVPSRKACGSCHDDIDWDLPYTSNGSTMPEQPDNQVCTLCHPSSGTPLSPTEAHLHPLLDPAFNLGTVVTVTAAEEAGLHDGDGTLDPGEKIAVTMTITDQLGGNLAASSLAALDVALSGPITNRNLVLSSAIPRDAIGSGPTYSFNLPEPVLLEFVGTAVDDLAIETFATARTPHWATGAAPTAVLERTASGLSTLLSMDAAAGQNYVDVFDPGPFVRDEYVVLDDGLGNEEYRQIALVDGSRLWFKTPYSAGFKSELRYSHIGGSVLREVTLSARTAGTHYTLNAATGEITEMTATSFLAGNDIVANYWSDFLVPGEYPTAINGSPDLGEDWGDWTAKPLASGTYSVGVWGSRNLTLSQFGENNSYRSTATSSVVEILVGDASVPDEYDLVSGGGATCYACHSDVIFHGGGRRGWDTCILCHGTAGSEDRARYIAGNAPETEGVTVDFRNMLHKIHTGAELAYADTWTVVGFGGSPYPNNFTAHTYGEVGFPALPGGTQNCTMCHGAGNQAWMEPSDRNHPTDRLVPAREWRAACNSCHDSDDATAHIELNTTPAGVESCAVCHGPGAEYEVEVMHKPR